MGQGIAQWLAQVGVEVYLSDINVEAIHSGLENIKRRWQRQMEKKRFSAYDIDRFEKNLCPGGADQTPWADLDIVIEAVVEDMAVKLELFRSLPLPLDSSCIIASNTSSLSIDKLAKGLPAKLRAQFLGLHFFNPAPAMKLVEVVAGPESAPDICKSMVEWLRNVKKFQLFVRINLVSLSTEWRGIFMVRR